MARNNKSAFEEALGFLGGLASGAKGALSGVSNFTSDYDSWLKNREEEERKAKAKRKAFVSDAVDYFKPEKAADRSNFWKTPAAKNLARIQQDISGAGRAITQNARDFSNLAKSTSTYFDPKQATIGANFWKTPAANTLAKTQLGLEAFPKTLTNVGLKQATGGTGLMTSLLLNRAAKSYRQPKLELSLAGPLGTIAKFLMPRKWREDIAFFLEDKSSKIKDSALNDFSEAEQYIRENPASVNFEEMELLEKVAEPEWWSQSIGANAPNTIASAGLSLGAGFATGNPLVAILTAYGASYMMEGGGLYYDALESGAPEEEAQKIAITGAPIIALLDFIVPGKWGETAAARKTLTKLGTKDFVKLVMTYGGIEAVTESGQEFILNTLAKYGLPFQGIQGYDPMRPLSANVLEAGVQAFPLGFGGTTVTTVLSGRQGKVPVTEQPTPVISQEFAQEVYDEIVKKGGITISLQGKQPKQGFSYAPSKETQFTRDSKEFTTQDILDYVDNNYESLSAPGNNFGGWLSEGNTVLDVSRVGTPSVKTIEDAQKGEQEAIFDLEAEIDIPVGKIDNGVYNILDEAANILNKHRREIKGTDKEGGPKGVLEIQADKEPGGKEIIPPTTSLQKVENTEDFWLSMRNLRKFRGYKSGSFGIQNLTDEEISMKALKESREFQTIEPETIEKLAPEAIERINQLIEVRASFAEETGNIEDVLKNYNFYTKRFGRLMLKKELNALKRELRGHLSKIDKEIKQLQKQKIEVEAPVLTDEELAMQALERSRKPITEVVEEVTTPPSVPPESLMEVKKKFGKDIQEQIDKETEKLPDSQEIDTGRGKFSRIFNGTKGWNKDIKNRFANWANSYNTAILGEIRVKEQFTKFDSEGMDAVLEVQRGEKKGKYKEVREFFDERRQEVVASGINVGYWEDYLPGIWENSDKEIEKAFTGPKRKTSKNPDFSMQKVFENDQEGIDYGLTPKYKTISQRAGWYEKVAQVAIANKKFFDYLSANKFLLPDHKAPRSWVNLDVQAFRKYQIKTDEGTYRGTYKASPELADSINTIIGNPSGLSGAIFKETAKFASTLKGVILSSGIPGTGITFHTFNVLARYINSANNPLGAGLKGGIWMIKPNVALKTIKSNAKRFEEFVAAGMTGSSEDQGISREAKEVQGNLVKKGYIKMKNWQEKTFEHNIFQKIIPALKLDFAEDTYGRLIEKGLSEKEAMRQAAALANEQFGGINTEQIARNKDFQNILRTVLLASDWMETNVRLGTGMARAFIPGQRSKLTAGQKMVYTRMARNLLLTMIVYAVFNKALSDKWPWENDKGNEFNIDTGLYSSNGQKIYLRPFGTSLDYVRLPFQIAQAAMSGDFSVAFKTLRNRLSPVISTGMAFLTDRDYANRPIGTRGVDQYGNPMTLEQRAGGITSQILGTFFPSFVRSPIDYATGRVSAEEAVTRAAELPLRYSGGAFTDSQRREKDLLKSSGITNQGIYDFFQGEREENKLKKDAKKILKEKGEGGLEAWFSNLFSKETDADERLEAIRIKYKLEDTLGKDATTVVEKAKLETKKLQLARNIWENSEEVPGLTEEEKVTLIEEIGFGTEDVAYYSIADETSAIKFAYVEDLLTKVENADKISTLAALRYEVGGEMILSNGVINDLFDMGYITTAEKKYLKSLMWDQKNDTFKTKPGTSGSNLGSSRRISLKTPPLKRTKIAPYKIKNFGIRANSLTAGVPEIPSTSLSTNPSRYRIPNFVPTAPQNLVPTSLNQLGR